MIGSQVRFGSNQTVILKTDMQAEKAAAYQFFATCPRRMQLTRKMISINQNPC